MDELTRDILDLRAEGKKYDEIAAELDITRNAVAGRIWRHENPGRAPRDRPDKTAKRKGTSSRFVFSPKAWTDKVLTERWEDRKRRRAAERQREKRRGA